MTVPCCVLCICRKRDNHLPLTDAESQILKLKERIDSRIKLTTNIIDVDELDENDELEVQAASQPKRRGNRRGDHLQLCRTALESWRRTFWDENYSYCAWGPKVFMPDTVITKLATRARISTPEDIKCEVPEWGFIKEHGIAVLSIIHEIDKSWKEKQDSEKAEKAAKRKRESIEKKEIRDEERREEKRAATNAKRHTARSISFHPPLPPVPSPVGWHQHQFHYQYYVPQYPQPTPADSQPRQVAPLYPQPIQFAPLYFPPTQFAPSESQS